MKFKLLNIIFHFISSLAYLKGPILHPSYRYNIVNQELGTALKTPNTLLNKVPKVQRAWNIVEENKPYWVGVFLRSSLGTEMASCLSPKERLIVMNYFQLSKPIPEVVKSLNKYGIYMTCEEISVTIGNLVELVCNKVTSDLKKKAYLDNMYYHGQGVDRSDYLAMHFFIAANTQGYPNAKGYIQEKITD